ncbi:MAG: fibronectin type III-like domain-contianing protein, partial [Oscillospiraceae bacterium]|nr:fibronectin type III-like domain-contianing protein [Oscillospiraceae bacterium]
TCGSAVECPWADRVKSILYLGLPGQAGGEAAADLLFGRVSPSGKLAETWPLTYDQCPTAPDYGEQDAQYRESLYVGYRCYDKSGQPVRWPFGHGLSYSAFVWHDLEITHTQVSCRITNTGPVPAAEVAQLYVEPPQCGLHRPLRELKGFQKLFLQPGQTGTVTFPLTDRTFALWQDGWVVPGGTYTLHVGGSSRDLPLRGALTLDGPTLPSPHWQPGSWYETLRGTPAQSGWEAMLGRTCTPSTVERGHFTKEHSVLQMSGQSRLMRWMLNIVKAYVARGFGGKQDESDPAYCMMVASSCDAALFNLMNNSGMPPKLFELLLKLANGFKRTGGTP